MIYPPNIEEIRKFSEKIKLDVKYLLGEKYEGDLKFLDIVEHLPANIQFNVDGKLDLHFIKSLSENIVFNVSGKLDLYSVKSLPSNIVFNVSNWLWLDSTESISKNVVFDVGRYIDLNSVETIHCSVQFVNCWRLILPEDKKVKIIW